MAINETISRAVGAATSALGQPIRYLTEGGEFAVTAIVRRTPDPKLFAVVTVPVGALAEAPKKGDSIIWGESLLEVIEAESDGYRWTLATRQRKKI